MFWRYYGPIILKCIPKIGATFAERETKCLIMLYQILITRFNRDELITLCFHLGIDYEDLPDRGRANKARELIKYLARHEQVSELINIGCELRPDISWPECNSSINNNDINQNLRLFFQDNSWFLLAILIGGFVATFFEQLHPRKIPSYWLLLQNLLILTIAVYILVPPYSPFQTVDQIPVPQSFSVKHAGIFSEETYSLDNTLLITRGTSVQVGVNVLGTAGSHDCSWSATRGNTKAIGDCAVLYTPAAVDVLDNLKVEIQSNCRIYSTYTTLNIRILDH